MDEATMRSICISETRPATLTPLSLFARSILSKAAFTHAFAIPLPCNSSLQITVESALVHPHSSSRRDHTKNSGMILTLELCVELATRHGAIAMR